MWLTPEQMANVDQKCARLGALVDELTPHVEGVIAEVGPEVAALQAAVIVDHFLPDPGVRASLLGFVLVRLAQHTADAASGGEQP